MSDSSAIAALLATAHPGATVTRCDAVAGGRNNRVFRLNTTAGPFALKEYFSGGDWDRMAAESRFLRFTEESGIDCCPRLLAADSGSRQAIMEWLDGCPPGPDDVTPADTTAAAAFLRNLIKASEGMPRGLKNVPAARDACLTPADFFRSPEARLAELDLALREAADTAIIRDAANFLWRALIPAWEKIKTRAAAGMDAAECGPAEPFAEELLFFSPSDFGFHNALRLPGGDLRFVDFEYAGRDSVVKAAADFLCQPSVPPSAGAEEVMTAAAADGNEERMAELSRLLRLVLPAVRLKFCCIIMNDFKTPDAARRIFALSAPDSGERPAAQLAKARAYFEKFVEGG